MNDKEAQTQAPSTDNALGQAGLGFVEVQTPEHDAVAVTVAAEPPIDSAAEASVQTSFNPAAEPSTGSSVESAAEPVPGPQALVPEVAWMSPNALPGEVFVARREELRWSLEEAATRLKLTPRQVSALEANDFASLPGMASVRGFVRSYAKALGLDPEPLLEMLAREPNPAHGPMVLRRPLPTKGFPGRPSAPARKSKWRMRAVIAVVFLAAGFAAGVEAYRSQWVQLPPIESLAVDIQLPDLGSMVGSFLGVPGSAPAPEQAAEAAPQAENTPAAQPQVSVPALQLKLSEDAWVEITTVSGQRIVSQLIKGGSTASFDIPEPSVLVVGNASAVEARLRGQQLNLKAVARDNVSKLSIK